MKAGGDRAPPLQCKLLWYKSLLVGEVSNRACDKARLQSDSQKVVSVCRVGFHQATLA